jgi:hypothetical protein
MNRRELLRDVGVAAATASPLLASSASQAQGGTAGATVLIAYHSKRWLKELPRGLGLWPAPA